MSEYTPELGPYNQQVSQADNHTEKLVATVGSLALGLGATRKVVNGAAADFQHYTAGMAAATKITGQSYAQLSAGARQLARDLPVSQKEAAATIEVIQHLGLTAKGQEGQIRSLGRVMTELAGATGSVGPAMAESFGQLNRQMASLDPARVRRFADELTKASTIAPAANVVDFSRQIAPAAQASGMGMGAVMGISTAFAKQGDDSFVAVNAVNKMLTDLNRSVHEGTPEMAKYASAVGMTAREFKNMYQNNPTDAVSTLINAVGKAGPQSMRILDELGIGSPRAQRAFLNVAQEGGLQPIMQQVTGAYGSGLTATASKTAFNNVQDSMTRLGSAASQVAQTFERPLLGAANNIIKLAGAATRGIGDVVGSGPIGAVANVAMQAALPLTVAHMGMRVLNMGALAGVAGRSTFVRGAMAGAYSSRRGGVGNLDIDPRTGRLLEGPRSRDAQEILERAYHGSPLADNQMAAGRIGKGMEVGSFLGALFPQGQGGTSMFQRARGVGMMGLGFMARGQAEMYRIARTSPTERDAMRMSGFTAPHQAFAAHLTDLREQIGKGTISHADALKSAASEFDSLSSKAGEVTPALKELGMMVKTLGVEATVTSAGGLKGLAGGLGRGVMGMAGGPMGLAMMGGFAGYEIYQHQQAANKARDEHTDSLFSPDNSMQNRYNDAIGLAAQNTQTFADALARSSDKVTQAITTVSQAAKVTTADRIAAGSQTQVAKYRGTVGQVEAAVEAGFPTKPSPAQLDRVKQDLVASGYSDQDIKSIITNVGNARQSGVTASNVTTLGRQAGQDSRKFAGGTHDNNPLHGSFWHQVYTHTLSGLTGGEPTQLGLPGGARPGDPGQAIEPGDDAKREIDQAASDISSQFNQIANDPNQGPNMAVQWLFRTVNQIMATLAKAPDNGHAFAYGSQVFSRLVTGLGNAKGRNAKTSSFSAGAYNASGGSFTQLLDKHGATYGSKSMADWAKLGANPTAANVAATPTDPSVIREANAAAPGLAGLLGGTTLAPGIGPRLLKEFQTGQSQGFNNTGLTNITARQLVNAATQGGTSPGALAAQATALGARNPDLEQLTGQISGLAQQQFQRSISGLSQPEQWQAQINDAEQGLAKLVPLQKQLADAGLPSDDTLNAQIETYTNQLDTIGQSEKQSFQSRIMAQYDFQKNYARSQEQFSITVERSNRDYNIQLQRQREDSAKSLYDPYTRISAKPVFDAGNLLQNTREQLQAMRQQVTNIKTLRHLGLDEASIRMLGLYDPKNAQQVQQLVNDMQADHSLAGQFNQNAAARQRVGGQLLSEDPQFKRARQDHNRQLSDMRKDQARQLAYMVQDNKEQDMALTGDMTTLTDDMNKIIHGQHVDLSNQLHGVWDTTLNQASDNASRLKKLFQGIVPKDLLRMLNLTGGGAGGGGGGGGGGSQPNYSSMGALPGGGTQHWGGSAHSGNRAVIGSHYDADTGRKVTDYGAAGSYTHDYGRVTKGGVTWPIIENMANHGPSHVVTATTNGQHASGSYHYKGEAVDFSNAGNDSKKNAAVAHFFAANFGHRLSELIWAGPGAVAIKDGRVVDGLSVYGAATWAQHKNHVHVAATPNQLGDLAANYQNYAVGGIATKPHFGMVAEAGVNEAMIPLDRRGIGVLSDAFAKFMPDQDALSALRGGGHPYAVHINDSSVHHHDMRKVFDIEHMHVEADNPNEFARKADERTRRDNLTRARGVAWSTSR